MQLSSVEIYKRRMAVSLAANMCSTVNSKRLEGIKRFDSDDNSTIRVTAAPSFLDFCNITDQLQSRSNVVPPSLEVSSSRRHLLVTAGVSFVTLTFSCGSSPWAVWAEEKSADQVEEDKGIIGTIKSLLDPDEKTKSGKVLPKAYLKSAREVVKTLRESLNEDTKDIAKFRRTADSAKESIREYLSKWKGEQTVVREESYVELEKAIRSLANFYSKAGPSAPLPEEVKSEILDDLNTAEEFL